MPGEVWDQTQLLGGAPYLPKEIFLFAYEPNLRKAADLNFVFRSPGESARLALSPWQTQGMLMGAYTVEQATNFQGWFIPTAFTYQQYIRYSPDQQPWVRYEVKGTVVRISKSENGPQPVLKEGRLHQIQDTRFRHDERIVDSLLYVHGRAVLPATNDPVLLAKLEEIAKFRSLSAEFSAGRRVDLRAASLKGCIHSWTIKSLIC